MSIHKSTELCAASLLWTILPSLILYIINKYTGRGKESDRQSADACRTFYMEHHSSSAAFGGVALITCLHCQPKSGRCPSLREM